MRARDLGATALSFLLIGSLAGCASAQKDSSTPPPQPPAQSCDDFRDVTPTSGPVEVTLSADGTTVEVTPDSVAVRRGGTVTWQSHHPFIVFVKEDPNRGRPTPKASYAGKHQSPAQARIPAEASCGYYKYSVAVYLDGEMRGLDPEIWILPE